MQGDGDGDGEGRRRCESCEQGDQLSAHGSLAFIPINAREERGETMRDIHFSTGLAVTLLEEDRSMDSRKIVRIAEKFAQTTITT